MCSVLLFHALVGWDEKKFPKIPGGNKRNHEWMRIKSMDDTPRMACIMCTLQTGLKRILPMVGPQNCQRRHDAGGGPWRRRASLANRSLLVDRSTRS